MGRILAIDYGKKRVGIAVTDPLKIVANALDTVDAKLVLEYLKTYMSKESVECFVVGQPFQNNGQASESSIYIEPFVKKLKETFPETPVHRIDERFTTLMAKQVILNSGQDKRLADRISATIILQSYMSTL
jgi:putative holliday junction resolvase